jgi:hypothetical protein
MFPAQALPSHVVKSQLYIAESLLRLAESGAAAYHKGRILEKVESTNIAPPCCLIEAEISRAVAV